MAGKEKLNVLFRVHVVHVLFCAVLSLRLREMMRRSLRAAGLGRHESGPSSSDHQDPVSPPIAPPSWVPDPPPMDPGQCNYVPTLKLFLFFFLGEMA